MTTAIDGRQSLAEHADKFGWQRREHARADVYNRGLQQLQVIWRDRNALNGAAYYEDLILMSTTRDLGKVASWLAK